MLDTKRCSRCKETKPREDYYTKMDHGKLVLQGYCKPCERERRRESYWENPEKERKRVKRNSLKNGRRISVEADLRHNEQKKEQRLALRIVRANLITKLCMDEYEIEDRESLQGRHLLGVYEECASMSVWLIRKYTFFSRDAIAEMFNCATVDVHNRIKTSVKENSWELGDILFIRKKNKVLKRYQQLKPKHFTQVEVLPYETYSIFLRAPKKNVAYATPNRPPEGIPSEKMKEVICWYYGASMEGFMTDTIARGSVAKARQVYFYLLHRLLGVPVETIAQLWGKDVSTVFNSIKTGNDYMNADRGNLFYEMHKRFPSHRENQTCPGEQMIS